MSELVLSEIFGPTAQGEGPSAGRRCGFVRLGRCNLDCSWCDTPYTWDWKGKNGKPFDPVKELTRRSVVEVVAEVVTMGVDRVVITGGEPMLQATGLADLCAALRAEGMAIEIETNGTIKPSERLVENVTHFNVSPKLEHSGCSRTARYNPDALTEFAAIAVAHAWGAPTAVGFKFVCLTEADLDEIEELATAHHIPDDCIWIMPEGTHATTLMSRMGELSQAAVDRGWNITGRLHVMAWGDERGR